MSEAILTVTPAAAAAAKDILAKSEKPHAVLRVGVRGGGCSGFEYVVKLDATTRETDLVVEQGGVTVVVDPRSLEYLRGTTLDYERTLMRHGFVFRNPQATQSCSCGTSFSV